MAAWIVGRQARGRDVDRLLEEGAVERVGLVEERQHVQLAVGQQPLQRHLEAGDERLDQEMVSLGRARSRRSSSRPRDARERRDELGRVVGADHAAAAGEQRAA